MRRASTFERRSLCARGSLVALSWLTVLAACSKTSPPLEPETGPIAAHPIARALEDYLPPTGLKLAVQLHPRALFAHPTLGSELRALIPDPRLDAFRASTGVELRELHEVWFAEYELGALYLLPFAHAEALGVRYLERSESQGREQQWSPTLTSYSLVRKRSPWGLVVDQGYFGALVEKDLSLGRLIVARALGKLDKIEPPLHRLRLNELTPDRSGLATLFWVARPRWAESDLAPTEPGEPGNASFSDSIDIGCLSLFDESGRLALDVRLRVLSEDDPLAGFRGYLEELAARPELRLILGHDSKLEELGCAERNTNWQCRASVELDVASLGRSWGKLLQGGLDSF